MQIVCEMNREEWQQNANHPFCRSSISLLSAWSGCALLFKISSPACALLIALCPYNLQSFAALAIHAFSIRTVAEPHTSWAYAKYTFPALAVYLLLALIVRRAMLCMNGGGIHVADEMLLHIIFTCDACKRKRCNIVQHYAFNVVRSAVVAGSFYILSCSSAHAHACTNNTFMCMLLLLPLLLLCTKSRKIYAPSTQRRRRPTVGQMPFS